MKKTSLIPSAVATAALVFTFGIVNANAANDYFAGDNSLFSASKWSTTSGGPYTSAFVTGSDVVFNVVSGQGKGASITASSFTATEDFTLTATGGTISNQSNGVIHISVSSGKTLDFSTQAFTTSATAGYIKDGAGVLALAGGTYGGGFTMNSGTLVARGINAMGGNATPGALTINGGTIAANASRDFSGKYSGITVGGNFQLGALASAVSISSDTANLTFNSAVGLGGVTRTVTIGANGTYTLGGVLSNGGLTIDKVSGATGNITLSGANTYAGGTTINGGTLKLSTAGTLGTGDLAVAAGATFDITGATTGYTLPSSKTLSGAGTIITTGKTFTASGTISPGTSSVATLAFTGGLTLDSTSKFAFTLGNTSDLVTVSGALALGSANLDFSDFTFTAGTGFTATAYTLISGATSLTGSLAASGLSGTINGYTGTLSMSGNNLILTVTGVPEPHEYAIAIAGLLGLVILARRRKGVTLGVLNH